jgi:D-beta-D-heptose 7-phosphate kinase/D-beta-D-heptose 1-phosphate adenosyltransferase
LAQHRHQQQLFRMDYESTQPLTEKQYAKLAEIIKDKLKSADIVCLQDYNKGVLAESFCRQAIRLAVQAGKKVLIDPSPITNYAKYTGATLITPNRQETCLGVGFEIKTIDDAKRAARQLMQKLKLESIVITLDKEGAYLKSPGFDEQVPTRPRNVYDVTGAGDVGAHACSRVRLQNGGAAIEYRRRNRG